MVKNIKISIIALFTIMVSSCELDLLDNPNAVTPNNIDVNFLLSNIQTSFSGHFNNVSDPGMRLTRMLNQGAAIYENAVGPGNFNGTWTTAYAGILNDVKTIIPIAEKSELFVHAGIARTIRAYVSSSLVDGFGDVPYTDALNAENFTPKADGGASVYTAAIADLDKAVENFNATSKGAASGDLMYGGSTDSWIRIANTIKLKLLLNRRLIDKAGSTSAINALIAGNRLVSTAGQNFVWRFGSNLTNPDTRHPRYAGQYLPTGGGDYQSNSYMGALHNDKSSPDPRIRYYFYRPVIVILEM